MSLDSSRGSSGSLDASRAHLSWFELLPEGPGAVQVCSGLLPMSLGAGLLGSPRCVLGQL